MIVPGQRVGYRRAGTSGPHPICPPAPLADAGKDFRPDGGRRVLRSLAGPCPGVVLGAARGLSLRPTMGK